MTMKHNDEQEQSNGFAFFEDGEIEPEDEAEIFDLDQPENILRQRAERSQRFLKRGVPIVLVCLALTLLIALWPSVSTQIALLQPTPTAAINPYSSNQIYQMSFLNYKNNTAYITVYFIGKAYLSQIDLNTGKEKWKFNGDLIHNPLLYANHLYVTLNDRLIILDADNHKIIWSKPREQSDDFTGFNNNSFFAINNGSHCNIMSNDDGHMLIQLPQNCSWIDYDKQNSLLYALAHGKHASFLQVYHLPDGQIVWSRADKENDQFIQVGYSMQNEIISTAFSPIDPTVTETNIFNITDGSMRWSLDNYFRVFGNWLKSDSQILYAEDLRDHTLHAFNIHNGDELWKTSFPDDVSLYPSFDGQVLYYLTKPSFTDLYALSIQDGHQLWLHSTDLTAILSDVAGVLYGTTADNQVAAINEKNGQGLWHYGPSKNGQTFYRIWSVDQSNVYLVNTVGQSINFIILTIQNGHELWKQPAGIDFISNDPAIHDRNHLYFVDEKGAQLNLLDWKTGHIKWRYLPEKLPSYPSG